MTIESGIIALSGYDVPNAQAQAYLVPGGVNIFRIEQASVTNYTGAPVTLTLYVLQNGESVADVKKAFDALSIPANTNIPLFELIGRNINQGGEINAFASAATSLSLSINGTNFS